MKMNKMKSIFKFLTISSVYLYSVTKG